MTKSSKHRAEAGIAHVAVILSLVVLVAAVVAIYFMVRSETKITPQSSNTSDDYSLSRLKVNQRNTARLNETSNLLGAVAEYINNNSGKLPTSYDGGALIGAAGTFPVSVALELYDSVVFASGKQSAISSSSELRFVSGAECGEAGATITSSSLRNYVVQYQLEKVGGGYTAECKEG